MRRMIAAVRTGLVLLAVLVAGPMALAAVAGPPLPRRWPPGIAVRAWVGDPLDPRFAAVNARAVAWLLWLFCAGVIVVCVAARWRHLPGHLRRLPGYLPPPVQGLSAALLGAAAVTSSAIPASAAPVMSSTATVPQLVPSTTAASSPEISRTVPPAGAAPVASLDRVPHDRQQPTCTVHTGDSLFDLAAAHLGDGDRWPEIYALNKGHRFSPGGPAFTDPDLIHPGWTLRLPPHRTAPAARPGAGEPQQKPPAPVPPPRTPPDDTTPNPTAPPAPTSTASRSSLPSAGAGRSSSPAPAAPDSAPSRTAGGSAGLGDPGWVAAEVTAAVAALTLLWLHRRRRYRPQPLRRRPDGTPPNLPPPVAAVARHDHSPPEDDMDALTAPRIPSLINEVMRGRQPGPTALQLSDLPAGGIGLTGAGGEPAARGILAAVLHAAGPWAPGAEAAVITTRTDMARLVGDDRSRTGDRLHVAATADEALDQAEHHLLQRARIVAGDDLTDRPGTTEQSLAPVIIMIAVPGGSRATRLAAILTVGASLGITAVILGPWAPQSWQVAGDGTTTGPGSGPRLTVLDQAAAAALIDAVPRAEAGTPAAAATETPPVKPAPRPPGQAAISHTRPRSAQPASPAPSRPPAPGPGTHRLALTVLGRPSLTTAPGEDVRIRRSDGMQLLAHLAVHRSGASSDELMTALWPEVRPRYARGRFHTTMSELRGVLHEAVHAEVLPRTGERYHLDPATVDVDLWHLEAAIDRAYASLEPAAYTAALHEVITGYTGELADGHSWLWLIPHRERLRRQILDTHIALADNEKHPSAALRHVENAIRVDAYNEDIYHRAMGLHAALGSTDGIRRTLRALSQRLQELEVPVSPQTQQIARELIRRADDRPRTAGSAA